MVFGDTSNERIQLNDDSMWPGDIGWNHPDGSKEDIEHIRELSINFNHQNITEYRRELDLNNAISMVLMLSFWRKNMCMTIRIYLQG